MFCFFVFFFQKCIILLCSGEIQTKTKRSLLKNKNPISCRWNPWRTWISSCVFLSCSHGLAWLLSALQKWSGMQPNQVFCARSFPVQSANGGLKSGPVVNQAKPNTSVCEPEKRCDFYLAKRFVSADPSGVCVVCLCDAASMPSETESVNTDNHTGADDKSPCCGPLWWVLLSLSF